MGMELKMADEVMNLDDLKLDCKFERDLVDALREVVDGSSWQCIGSVDEYLHKKCTVLYAINDDPADRHEDIAVFCVDKNTLYAIDTVCPHEGGPLELGDIEELDGVPVLYCPWHHYDFNLNTGKSSTGLQQQTHTVRIVDSKVYINVDVKLSRNPNTKQLLPDSNNESSSISSSEIQSKDSDSLCHWAVKILCTADPEEKVRLTFLVAEQWQSGKISKIGHCLPPSQPCRHQGLKVVQAGKTKRLGKAGSLGSRISLIHSLANIEQWAIDLSWDIIARFSDTKQDNGLELPKEFFSDFVKVAKDEAKHYKMLSSRLIDLGSHFGELPVHNGLWESAVETSHCLLSRLAIVHMVHEARGLDVHPKTFQRFLRGGDKQTAELLEVLYKDEITHVAAGIKWFSFLCDNKQPCLNKIPVFHELVRKHFRGYLKPPFDTVGRELAGMTDAIQTVLFTDEGHSLTETSEKLNHYKWYLPLVKQS